MIKPYSEIDKRAADLRREERGCLPELWIDGYPLGSTPDHGRDIRATASWFYHRRMCCSPATIVEDELKFGGVYTSDAYRG